MSNELNKNLAAQEVSQDKINEYFSYLRMSFFYHQPFYASFLLKTQIKYVSYGEQICFTDGINIFLHKNFTSLLTKQEFVYVIYHNLIHILSMHSVRLRDKKKYRWNQACDIYVDNIIKNSLNTNFQRYIANPLFANNDFKDLSTEEIYFKLPPNKQDNKRDSEDNNSPDDSFNQELQGDGNEADGKLDISKDKFNLSKSMNGDLKSKNLTPEEIMELNNNILESYMAAKNIGNVPQEVERIVADLVKGKVNWRQELKEFLQSFINDYDFFNRDRRFMSSDFLIPSLHGNKLRIAFAGDTSGSISADELNICASEVYSIFSHFDNVEILLMSCDATVHNPQVVHSREEVENYQFVGGGGTDFVPVFNYIEKEYKDITCLIYFTDGYGTFPQSSSLKTIWLMTTNQVPPFGKIIRYEMD